MKLALTLLGPALLLSGCETGMIRYNRAVKDMGRGNFDACIMDASRSLELYQREIGDPDQQSGTTLWWFSEPYRVRAHCLKSQGKLSAAISDLEKAVNYANAGCSRCNWPEADVKGRICKTAADDNEKMAQWKKELGSARAASAPAHQ